MQYHPKLKAVMKQIQKILDANDVAAMVVLAVPGHAEFRCDLSKPWNSVVKKNSDGTFVIRGKREHFVSDEDRRTKLSNTCNMLANLSVTAMQCGLNMAELSELADKTYNAEHTSGDPTSETQQNN